MGKKPPEYKCGHRIEERWEVVKTLGSGSFGIVYCVKDLCDPEKSEYALKMDYNCSVRPKLELYVMKLAQLHNCKHFCKGVAAGITTGIDRTSFVVMTQIGHSLEDKKKEHRFTLGCALSVGMQCLTAIEELHSIGFLHRDLKPENFAVAYEDQSRVMILDFGCSRAYMDANGRIRLPRFAMSFQGTQRYAPLSCHLFREFSRKDDLETWFYQQVELTKGMLPWRAAEGYNYRYEIGLFKERCRYGIGLDLFLGGCPRQFVEILRYIDGLGYYDQPDYNKIHNLMRMAMQAHEVFETYDWVERAKEKAQKVIAKDL